VEGLIQERKNLPAGTEVSVKLHPVSVGVGAITELGHGSGNKSVALGSQRLKPTERSSHWSKKRSLAATIYMVILLARRLLLFLHNFYFPSSVLGISNISFFSLVKGKASYSCQYLHQPPISFLLPLLHQPCLILSHGHESKDDFQNALFEKAKGKLGIQTAVFCLCCVKKERKSH